MSTQYIITKKNIENVNLVAVFIFVFGSVAAFLFLVFLFNSFGSESRTPVMLGVIAISLLILGVLLKVWSTLLSIQAAMEETNYLAKTTSRPTPDQTFYQEQVDSVL